MALRPPHQALVGPPLPGPPGPPMMLPPMARAPGPPLGSMAALRPPLVSVNRVLMVRGAVDMEILDSGLMDFVQVCLFPGVLCLCLLTLSLSLCPCISVAESFYFYLFLRRV